MQNLNINGVSSPAVTPQTNLQNFINQSEQSVAEQVNTVQQLFNCGNITDTQYQFLMSRLSDNLKAISTIKESVPAIFGQNPEPVKSSFDLFNQERPDFFKQGGRSVVLEYLKGLDVDKDEISKIAELIEGLEKSAVDGYLKQSAHDKSLNDENYTAKSKLTSYAQNAPTGSDIGRIFTREDIGNMSGEEFAKNEKIIMEQVKQGLIR